MLPIDGTAEIDVPYDRSVTMAAWLGRHGVEHALVTVEGAEHGLVDVDRALVGEAHVRAAAFLVEHLG